MSESGLAKDADNSRGLKRCREARSAIREFVRELVDSIVGLLKKDGPTNKEMVDLFFKLLAEQMAEVKKWDHKIEELAPVNDVYDRVKESREFFCEILRKIKMVVKGTQAEGIVLSRLQWLIPHQHQMPALGCAKVDRHNEAATTISPPDQHVCQPPPAKKRALEDDSLVCLKEVRSIVPRQQPVLHLPDVEMPKFTGNLLKWVEFWDIFDTLVHNNSAMTSVHKFVYLKSLLKGDEFDFVKNMTTNDTNYRRAVAVLKSRYGRVDKLVYLHRSELHNLKPVNKNCDNLREFFRVMESNISALESLCVETESFVTFLLTNLPSALKRRICKKWNFADYELITMDILREELYLELQNPQD